MHARVRVRIHACTCQLVKTASVSIESELSTAQLADSTPRARSSSSRADGLTLYAADESALPIVVLECKTSERARRKGGVEERMMGTGYRVQVIVVGEGPGLVTRRGGRRSARRPSIPRDGRAGARTCITRSARINQCMECCRQRANALRVLSGTYRTLPPAAPPATAAAPSCSSAPQR